MLYLSQVLGRPIRDLEGERVATVKDVIVRLGADDHPPVTGLVARYRRRDFFLSQMAHHRVESKWRAIELRHSRLATIRASRKRSPACDATCSTNN